MNYYPHLSQYFFCDYLMFIITIITFIVSVKYSKGQRQLKLIPYYLGAALLQDCIYFYNYLIEGTSSVTGMQSISVNIFMVIEFIIFYHYLYHIISSPKKKLVMKFIFISFLSIILFSWIIMPFSFTHILLHSVVLESLCLIVPCLFYFYQLFATPEQLILKNHPSFWIVTGIFFYNCCSIPIFLSATYISINLPSYLNAIFALNFILYSILFLLITRAYLCRKKDISY